MIFRFTKGATKAKVAKAAKMGACGSKQEPLFVQNVTDPAPAGPPPSEPETVTPPEPIPTAKTQPVVDILPSGGAGSMSVLPPWIKQGSMDESSYQNNSGSQNSKSNPTADAVRLNLSEVIGASGE
jgi:hypothetical protein